MSVHDTVQVPPPAIAMSVSDFADTLFGHLPRADQRRWAEAYLKGLLTTPGKKSVRRLAAAVSSSPTASHSLQQFLNASPWDWAPARRELTRLTAHWARTRAWSLTTAVLPKRGEHSVGVHRWFIPAAGRVVNCQQGLGAFAATDQGNLPVDWRLALPECWTEDAQRRERARIPLSVRHRPMSAYALDLVDTLRAGSASSPPPVVADMSTFSETDVLLRGLIQREQDFVIAVPDKLRVIPVGYASGSPLRTPPNSGPVLGAQQLLRQCGLRRPHTSTLMGHGGGARQVRAVSGMVHLAGSASSPERQRTALRVFTQCRPVGHRFAPVWITNMMQERIDELFTLAHLNAGSAATIQDMQENHGLLDFEGRSFPGWHHHMTLVSAAYAYRRLAPPAAHQQHAFGAYWAAA
ncbi:transposase [Streptomyces sp. H27-C3]|uniref:IS701 family transposase n=1 Tax=Streptomyces sp. H27-C3 TaxID=3046305 RepID=UPI0024B91878|nr:transposase [Streptomyces sp. H27-C3]MDJ0466755.1 transposase [Streptomyces sp. H27-C3]